MTEYEFLSVENIPTYLAERAETHAVIDAQNLVEIKEVGDGNLNLVFIIHISDPCFVIGMKITTTG